MEGVADSSVMSGKMKGLANLRPFPPGVSGNPGGRPSAKGRFRIRCRASCDALLESIEQDIAAGRLADVSLLERLRAIEVLGDRGGYLPADRQAKMILDVLSAPLSNEQRAAVSAELVGGDDEPAQLEAPADEGTDE